jgi:Domain of unknown function (DUF397)
MISSLSNANGSCVDADEGTGLKEGRVHLIKVKDSKDPDGPVLKFTDDEWLAFLAGVRLGEFDGFIAWANISPALLERVRESGLTFKGMPELEEVR